MRFKVTFIITYQPLNKLNVVLLIVLFIVLVICRAAFNVIKILSVIKIISRNRGTKNWINLLRKIRSSRIVSKCSKSLMLDLGCSKTAGSRIRHVFKTLWCRHILGLDGKVLWNTFGGGTRNTSRTLKASMTKWNCSIMNWWILINREGISSFVEKMSRRKEKSTLLNRDLRQTNALCWKIGSIGWRLLMLDKLLLLVKLLRRESLVAIWGRLVLLSLWLKILSLIRLFMSCKRS